MTVQKVAATRNAVGFAAATGALVLLLWFGVQRWRGLPPAVTEPGNVSPPAPTASIREQMDAELAALQQPGDAYLALRAGSIAGDRSQYRKALGWFRRAAALDPKLLPAISGQGQMWMELGRPGQAASAYEQALKLAPQEPQLLLELARAYTYLREFEIALRYAKSAERVAPDLPEVYRALAGVYAEINNPEHSLRYAARACERGPGDPENWSTWGALLLRLHRYPEAERVLDRAMALNSNHVESNLLMARVLVEGRKTPAADRQAFALLSRVRALQPFHAQAMQSQASIAVRAGNMPLAILLLREAREADPGDPATLLALGQALLRSGQGERM